MEECRVLDVVKKLARLIDEEAKGRIGRWAYYQQLDEIMREIDKAVLESCPALKTIGVTNGDH